MSSAFLFKSLLGTLLLPPANGLLLLLLAALFRRRRWAFGVALVGGTLLFLQSLPFVASSLIAPLEAPAGDVFVSAQGAQAIVVLGSGLRREAPEYGNDTVNERSLVRLRYGATLARRLQLPVLIAGGVPLHASRSEADVMAAIAEREFAVPVRWKESESKDTVDNARMSAEILKPAGVRRVVLVTQAFHMPRARKLFEANGLEVIPAPTDFKGVNEGPLAVSDFLPQAKAMQTSYYALHEWLGLAWIPLAATLNPT
ncbi:MAG: YdcF family protein [Candidatus Dechloromonas phosphoritropha]|jgi:uncharacterized SAM-binding protein YcdF (DUF218 family)